MPNKIRIKNKKAQVGETTTWIVATVVVIVVLAISIFIASSHLGKNKDVRVSSVSDFSVSESFFSYLLTKDNGKTIYKQLQDQGNLNEINGPLAVNISNYFLKNYDTVWIGVTDKTNILFAPIANDYFLTRRSLGELPYRHEGTIIEEVRLDEDKSISLVMVRKFE